MHDYLQVDGVSTTDVPINLDTCRDDLEKIQRESESNNTLRRRNEYYYEYYYLDILRQGHDNDTPSKCV